MSYERRNNSGNSGTDTLHKAFEDWAIEMGYNIKWRASEQEIEGGNYWYHETRQAYMGFKGAIDYIGYKYENL